VYLVANPLTAIAVGTAAGLHAAIWGLYKDSPHEGFTWRQFGRSVLVAAALGPLLAAWLAVPLDGPAAWLVLFGLVYGAERAAVESYKTFFRHQDQSKYTIPMQLAVFGTPVRSRLTRAVVGVGYLAAIGGGLAAIGWLDGRIGALPRWLVALTVGAAGGWFSAFGGAWKDAPIEGFQLLKFFRSPLIAASFGWVLLGFTDRWPVVVLASIGYTVAAIETYKTFFSLGKPPGKFADQPVLFPAMVHRRVWSVPVFVGIWAGLCGTYWLAAA
jgi:hypothetical protein